MKNPVISIFTKFALTKMITDARRSPPTRAIDQILHLNTCLMGVNDMRKAGREVPVLLAVRELER